MTRLVEKESQLGAFVLYSDAILEGHLDKVTVAAPIDVVVAEGMIAQMTVNATAKEAAVDVQKNVTVNNLHVQAAHVVIDGKGVIKEVQADADHIKVLTNGHKGACRCWNRWRYGWDSGCSTRGSSGTVGSQGEQSKPDGNAGGGSGGGSTGGQTDGQQR